MAEDLPERDVIVAALQADREEALAKYFSTVEAPVSYTHLTLPTTPYV